MVCANKWKTNIGFDLFTIDTYRCRWRLNVTVADKSIVCNLDLNNIQHTEYIVNTGIFKKSLSIMVSSLFRFFIRYNFFGINFTRECYYLNNESEKFLNIICFCISLNDNKKSFLYTKWPTSLLYIL